MSVQMARAVWWNQVSTSDGKGGGDKSVCLKGGPLRLFPLSSWPPHHPPRQSWTQNSIVTLPVPLSRWNYFSNEKVSVCVFFQLFRIFFFFLSETCKFVPSQQRILATCQTLGHSKLWRYSLIALGELLMRIKWVCFPPKIVAVIGRSSSEKRKRHLRNIHKRSLSWVW